MAFSDFANNQYIKTLDTGEIAQVGSFKLQDSGELQYVRVRIVFSNYTVTNETLKMNIHGKNSTASDTILFSSDSADLSTITGLTASWIGDIRLDFSRQPINAGRLYYPSLEITNYTRGSNDSYIGFAIDFPLSVYDNSEALFTDHPISTQIFIWK